MALLFTPEDKNARNEAVKLRPCPISNLYFSWPIFTPVSFFSISNLRFVLTIFAAVESNDRQYFTPRLSIFQ